jgi:Peptidase family M28
MRNVFTGCLLMAAVIGGVIAIAERSGRVQAQTRSVAAPAAASRSTPPANIDDMLLRWPILPGNERYAAIEGRRLRTYVDEQVAISRRYRDQGHPKFWGRIIGTSSDAESADWLAAKFKSLGLSDVRVQPVDLGPTWMPQSWDVTVTGGGKTVHLETAQPDYGSAGTPPEGLDLEAAYVAFGSEADFVGKNVSGKGVFSFDIMGMRSEGAAKRADAKGAAAIFEVNMLPGNQRYEAYPSGTKAPAFVVGDEDGYAVRDLIATLPAGQTARVKVSLDVKQVTGLKSALVWGTLPGATDETIYVMAHRDGWFDAAGDNAGGVASMLGLAAFYAKIPQAQRRRTMVFIGTDGHHNSGPGAGVGREWLVAHKDQLFSKTALMINCEHPSTIQTNARPRYQEARGLVWSNTYMAQQWYAGGPSRPALGTIALNAFKDFGVSVYLDPNTRAPAGDLGRFFTFLPGVATSEFNHLFHTDQETAAAVPWTGLEATTRAYAKIVDEVNKLPLSALQRAPETTSR